MSDNLLFLERTIKRAKSGMGYKFVRVPVSRLISFKKEMTKYQLEIDDLQQTLAQRD